MFSRQVFCIELFFSVFSHETLTVQSQKKTHEPCIRAKFTHSVSLGKTFEFVLLIVAMDDFDMGHHSLKFLSCSAQLIVPLPCQVVLIDRRDSLLLLRKD